MLDFKVFSIGLPKTGTTSLSNAAELLGLRSIHWPHDPETVRQIRMGDYRLKIMDTCDIVSDIPIPAIFPQLDRAFPGSKFILTERDCDSWLESERKAPFNADLPKPGDHRDFYKALLYGVTAFSEERFRWVYSEHHALIDRYFSGEKSTQLLRLNITEGDGWVPLCDFLGKDVPEHPFPHSNKAVASEEAPSRLNRTLSRAGRLLQRG